MTRRNSEYSAYPVTKLHHHWLMTSPNPKPGNNIFFLFRIIFKVCWVVAWVTQGEQSFQVIFASFKMSQSIMIRPTVIGNLLSFSRWVCWPGFVFQPLYVVQKLHLLQPGLSRIFGVSWFPVISCPVEAARLLWSILWDFLARVEDFIVKTEVK